jgi:hypothetical protein
MQEIPLTQGKVALVDDRDYGFLMGWKWRASRQSNGDFYAKRRASGKRSDKHRSIYMHRVILRTPTGMLTDHHNGNTLDNRRSNLRQSNRSQNAHNCGRRSDNISGHRGIGWHKKAKKWQVRLKSHGVDKYLGLYKDLDKAIAVRKTAEEEHVGEFAFNN